MAQKKAKLGRPPFVWTEEIISAILIRVAEGESIKKICQENGMPSWQTLREKRIEDEDFAARYARAREQSADAFDEQIDEEAKLAVDKDSAAAARVRIDALKWRAGKRNPRQYGDRVQVDAKVEDVTQRTDADVAARIAQLAGKAGIAVALGGAGAATEPETN